MFHFETAQLFHDFMGLRGVGMFHSETSLKVVLNRVFGDEKGRFFGRDAEPEMWCGGGIRGNFVVPPLGAGRLML